MSSFMLHQITAAESVAEVKAVGTVEIAPNVPSESTAKPPPFKDPAFVVSVCVHVGLSSSAAEALPSLSLPPLLISAAFWDWWSSSG